MTGPEPLTRRQLRLYIDVAFLLPVNASLTCLDSWLTGVLEIPPPAPRESVAEAWTWRALLLAREWLQIGQVPVFDQPAIDRLSPGPKPANWTARVVLALIETLPQSLYIHVLDAAFGLCAWAAEHPETPENREKFFTVIETFVKDRLRRIAVSGKSTLPVLRAAHARGIPFIHLGGGVYQLGWGNRARRIDRSTSARDSAIGGKLSGNKALTAALLRSGGLPAPVHEAAATADDALAAARRLGWPVVVKPLALDRGEGVTTDVADEATLGQAFEAAAANPRGGPVLIERQVPGICHRLFIAGGALLYAVKRWPMSVRGDGVQTVAQLVEGEIAAQARRPPWKRSEIRRLDELSFHAMVAAGFCPASVPERGVLVPLRSIESTAWGGVDEDVSARVHQENIKIALQAARLLSLDVAGVDLISTDIAAPWYENDAIINEVNFSPLLGDGDISARYVPAFLERLMTGNGRIPVEVFVGGEAAWRAAAQRWRILREAGVAACLTNAGQSFSPSGDEWIMKFDSLCQRVRAMLLCPLTGGIVLAVQTDEFLSTGLPFDTVDALTWIDNYLTSFRKPGPLPAGREAALARLLEEWRKFG
jgi:D-alanine-D-alanine ligase-like ATP-grasp enzyme